MDDPTTDDGRRSLLLLSSLGGLLGGLCCFPPIVLVLLGLAGVTTAANWGNLLYGEYRWYFRAMAMVFLIAGMTIYFRRRVGRSQPRPFCSPPCSSHFASRRHDKRAA
jgi:hypothetical protein